jgi:hypothetical protein
MGPLAPNPAKGEGLALSNPTHVRLEFLKCILFLINPWF